MRRRLRRLAVTGPMTNDTDAKPAQPQIRHCRSRGKLHRQRQQRCEQARTK
jgi:hypothetical protein